MKTHDTETDVRRIVHAARAATARLGTLPSTAKNAALEGIAVALERAETEILAANAADVTEAQIAVNRGTLQAALLERLLLDSVKLRAMATGVRAVAALDDPIGKMIQQTHLDSGLELHKIAVPLGVVAAIFESRPDAVTQITALALKSGNAIILKGGKEAARTTRALIACIHGALARTEIPLQAVGAVEGRASVDTLLQLDDLIDLVVPRGSNALVRSVQSRTRIPVLGHADGICHVYIDGSADVRMAVEIVLDSKLQYPAACNAAETVLVDRICASTVLPSLLERLVRSGVEVRGCAATLSLAATLSPTLHIVSAAEADWSAEYSAPIIACKILNGVEEAVTHVNTYGSGHTDAIVTADQTAADYFITHVDSASVFHNASTRFADGYRFGLGAELGISTGKLHARGPVGLSGLTTYKYVLYGEGHIVAPYTGAERRLFAHEL